MLGSYTQKHIKESMLMMATINCLCRKIPLSDQKMCFFMKNLYFRTEIPLRLILNERRLATILMID